jgi:hypothetical protein
VSEYDFKTIKTPDGDIDAWQGTDDNWYLDVSNYGNEMNLSTNAITQITSQSVDELIQQLQKIRQYMN